MTVNQVRSLVLNIHVGTQSTCQCSMWLGRASASWRCMSLQGVPSWGGAAQRSSCDHIRASCLLPGNRCDIRNARPPQEQLFIGSCSHFGIGIECAISPSERGGSHWTETDSAANQFGAPESAKDPRGTISVVCGPWLPLTDLPESLDRGATMTASATLPGESNAQILSSIINLVCPQCGGRMSEFQCEGRCCRNWLAEWEWANQATRRPSFRLPGHAARRIR